MSALDRDMAAAVATVVGRYRRRCWWADEDDLRQQAWLHVHRARVRRWRPASAAAPEDDDVRELSTEHSKTGDMRPLFVLAASRHVQRLLLSDSAPVSSSDHKRHELRGLRRAPVDALEEAHAPNVVAVEHIRAKVVVRLRELVGDRDAWRLLVGGRSMPRDVAGPAKSAEEEAEERELWRRTLARLAKDDELRRLWEELR